VVRTVVRLDLIKCEQVPRVTANTEKAIAGLGVGVAVGKVQEMRGP
jgi:hypothetical protein